VAAGFSGSLGAGAADGVANAAGAGTGWELAG